MALLIFVYACERMVWSQNDERAMVEMREPKPMIKTNEIVA